MKLPVCAGKGLSRFSQFNMRGQCDVSCPIGSDDISHFVYFAFDRGRMRGHAFLDHDRFEGAQVNHPITMMHESTFTAPLGIAIQDGNYVGSTGADEHFEDRRTEAAEANSVVPMLHAFAQDFLKVDYMFWVDQKPYFQDQVLTCFAGE